MSTASHRIRNQVQWIGRISDGTHLHAHGSGNLLVSQHKFVTTHISVHMCSCEDMHVLLPVVPVSRYRATALDRGSCSLLSSLTAVLRSFQIPTLSTTGGGSGLGCLEVPEHTCSPHTLPLPALAAHPGLVWSPTGQKSV